MNQKHIKVGEFYNQKLSDSCSVKVLVKSRRVEPKTGITKFEVWDEDAQEGEFVPARELSPLPAS